MSSCTKRRRSHSTAKKNYKPNDVEAARAYSSAYVEFVHYAERLYDAAENMAPESVKAAPAHAH